MPMLEEGFERLYWPPLVKRAVWTLEHPGYRYEKFETFAELNNYFDEECGVGWRKQEWAKFWIDQHHESARKDKRERTFMRGESITYKTKSSMEPVYEAAKLLLDQNPYLSCRKLTYILNRRGVSVKKTTAANLINRYKQETIVLDTEGD